MSSLTNIDPGLVAKGFSILARAFVCQKCHKIPLNPIQCKNNKCEKMICLECHSGGNDTCQACYEDNLSKTVISGNVARIHELLKFKCLKGCNEVLEIRSYKEHIKSCDPNKNKTHVQESKPHIPKMIPELGKKTERPVAKKPYDIFDSLGDDDVDDSSSDEDVEFKKEQILKKIIQINNPKTIDLSKDEVLKDLKISDLQTLKNDELKYFLEKRGLSISGNKEDLISRIIIYKNANKKTDDQIKKLIANDEIRDLTNENLEDILQKKGLKKSGNKDEKIRTLVEHYFLKKK